MEDRYSQDVEGDVTYLPNEAGGRKSPAFQGYRPQFHYSGQDWDAVQHYPDTEHAAPGETVRVIFSFLSADAHDGKIHPGMMFLIREGSRTVEYGKVTKIIDLAISAKTERERKRACG